jgi:hypothetical protein
LESPFESTLPDVHHKSLKYCTDDLISTTSWEHGILTVHTAISSAHDIPVCLSISIPKTTQPNQQNMNRWAIFQHAHVLLVPASLGPEKNSARCKNRNPPSTLTCDTTPSPSPGLHMDEARRCARHTYHATLSTLTLLRPNRIPTTTPESSTLLTRPPARL